METILNNEFDASSDEEERYAGDETEVTAGGMFDEAGYLKTDKVDEELLLRWTATLQPVPLPIHLAPTGGAPLAETTKDALLKVSPHIIAHMQRTAAQGGFQVVSPRQVPFSKCMFRAPGGRRRVGDHVVGSTAEITNVWPTIDGDDLYRLLPDEPLPAVGSERDTQPKTRTTPLTKAHRLMADPVLSCLVKGRAVVDILRRDDVLGDADALLDLLADAWSVSREVLDELDAYTLGVEGDLLRHAIKIDDVYPIMYAPIHIRKCISMCTSEISRQMLPDHTAMDWKRCRVFCQSVYALSMSNEGHKLTDMKCTPPPGDTSAPSNRHGVMVFQPAGGSAWTCAPETFSIYPMKAKMRTRIRGIPQEVLDALGVYASNVKPISTVLSVGYQVAARRSSTFAPAMPHLETIAEGYSTMIRSLYTGGARGKTAVATVRNLIYSVLEELEMNKRLRLVRYLDIALSEVKTHLGVNIVPDSMIISLADRFVSLGEAIRSRVLSEANKRGHTPEQWWADILSSAPERYKKLVEGRQGWSRVALWLFFRAPTSKWDGLRKKVHFNALRDASIASTGGVSLPPKKGSVERLLAAGRAMVRAMTVSFAAYYMGVSDVAMAMSDEAMLLGRTALCNALKEAAYLWVLRARIFRGTNVCKLAKDEEMRSDNHFRIFTEPMDLLIVPCPYRAFGAYAHHVENSPYLPMDFKRHIAGWKQPPFSECFKEVNYPLIAVRESKVTQYLVKPWVLGEDMERAWKDLSADLYHVANIMRGETEIPRSPPHKKQKAIAAPTIDLQIPAPTGQGFYEVLARLEHDQVDWVEDAIENMDEMAGDMITEATYESPDDLLRAIQAAIGGQGNTGASMCESVR